MKLYYHPASTTCRPIMLFAGEANIPLDYELVDLFTGAHYKPEYESVNPNHLVPVLEDDGFRLTESSAILKYLADKQASPAYPQDLQQRARVNERMDWVNTQLNRDLCYGFVYPQVFGFHKRRSDEAQQAQLEWGRQRAQAWLRVLDSHILGPGNNYVCGDRVTIADYYCASFVHTVELVGGEHAEYPNVRSWMDRMKALPSWHKVFSAVEEFKQSLKGQPLASV